MVVREPSAGDESSTTPRRATPEAESTRSGDGAPSRFERYEAWREQRIYVSRSRRLAWRIVVGVLGLTVTMLGVAAIPLPGPGWLIVFAGLGILATEFEPAQRLLEFARRQVTAWTDWTKRQNLLVRALIGLAVLACVAAALVLSLRFAGSPAWVPDWVPLVD